MYCMTDGFIDRCGRALGAGAFVCLALSGPASAASHEQIIASCKQALWSQIHACVVGKLGGPPGRAAPADLARARQQCGPPLVRPCVMREEQKEAAHKAPPAIPKEETAAAPAGGGVKPVFVAPPRTIADILAPSLRLGPALAFYFIYPVGIVVFGVLPGLRAESVLSAFAMGFLFGAFAYGTYDLTNYATLRTWTLQITMADIVYGALTSGLSAAAACALVRASVGFPSGA